MTTTIVVVHHRHLGVGRTWGAGTLDPSRPAVPPRHWKVSRGAPMTTDATPIAWFDQLSQRRHPRRRRQGGEPGRAHRAGLPVPEGFVITGTGYLAAMDEAGVRDQLRRRFDEARDRADDSDALQRGIGRAACPGAERWDPRGTPEASSARPTRQLGPTFGRGPLLGHRGGHRGTSFAGMHETFLNTVGVDAVWPPGARLLGVVVRRAGHRLSGEPGPDRGAGDRRGGAASGRSRRRRRHVHGRPVDR
jgi:hypothetical protein